MDARPEARTDACTDKPKAPSTFQSKTRPLTLFRLHHVYAANFVTVEGPN